jgi:hypothetical protein
MDSSEASDLIAFLTIWKFFELIRRINPICKLELSARLFAVSGFPNIGVLGEMGQGQLQLEFHQQNLLNEPRPIETSETINFTNHTVQPHDRNFFPTQFHSLTSSTFLLHI